MQKTILLVLVCYANISVSQPSIKTDSTNKKYFSMKVGMGVGQLRYVPNFPWGAYLRAGVKYKFTKNLSVSLEYDQAAANNYPKKYKIEHNSTVYGEQQFVNSLVGMTKGEYFSGKGSFQYIQSSSLSLLLNYDFRFGPSKKYVFTPKIGVAYLNNHYFATYLDYAYFTNDKLTGGTVAYNSVIEDFLGGCYGFEIGKNIGKKGKLIIQLNGEYDIKGEYKFDSYTAMKIGLGYEWQL